MLQHAETLVRLLHARLAPAAALRAALALLAARRRELATPPVPLATRAHLALDDGATRADLATVEQAGGLEALLAELSSIELAPERLDAAAYAALQRSVLDQLCGSARDPALLAEWERWAVAPLAAVNAPAGAASAAAPAPRVEVEVQHAARVQFAAERNGVPLVERVSITNRGDASLEGLELRLQIGPDFGPPARFSRPRLAPGETWRLDAPDVALDRARLATLVERTAGALHVELRAGPAILERRSLPVELLAWNEWARSLPDELLAAFVLPNDPAVATLLAAARDRLAAATGDASLGGYQGSGRERVTAIVRAIGECLQEQRLTYAALPASFERDGQKLRLPQQLLAHRMGNCIELSLLVAALLEQAALHPLILLVEGHAVAGAWRVADQFPTVAVDHLDLVRKLAAVGDVVWFDPTVMVSGGTFEQAVAAAHALCEKPEQFRRVVDVKAARLAGIVPLPTPGSALAADGAPRAATPAAAAAASAPAASPESDELPAAKPLADRIERWKQQLLDLSLRNRLIHWRDSKRCVALDGGDLAAIEDRLADGGSLDFAARAAIASGDPRSAELAAARGAEQQVALQRRDLFAQGALLTRHEPAELHDRLLALFREDRTSLEETGSSTLFLALGFLRWFESPASDAPRLAPLLLLPVQLERRGLGRRFVLRLRDDEPRVNEALLEKLRQELDVDPEALRTLPADERGVDVAELLLRFRKLVARVPRFEVVEEARLGFFSFAKWLLWRDLVQHRDALLGSGLVRFLVRGGHDALPDPAFVDPRRLDELLPPSRSAVVLDADSSQLVAIEAAVRGATFVLQGPPGTGKSQTIANIVAGCIAARKRVLFVAEKRAALDVVAHRLRRAGLGGACLELHSERASKHQAIAELARTVEESAAPPRDDDPLLAERVEQAARALDGYAARLHARGPLGWSHYDCLGRSVAARGAKEVAPLPIAQPQLLTRRDYEERQAAVAELAAAVVASGPRAGHAFAGCGVTDHSPLLARRWEGELRELSARAEAQRGGADGAAVQLGLASPPLWRDSLPAARTASATLALLAAEIPGRAAECATRSDAGEVATQLRRIAQELTEDRARRAQLAPRWNDRLFALDVAALSREFERHATAFAPLRWLKLRGAWSHLAPALRGKAPDVATARADLAQAVAVVERERALAQEARLLDATAGAAARGPATEPELLLRIAAFLDAWRALAAQWRAAGVEPPAVAPLAANAAAVAKELAGRVAAFEAATRAVGESLQLDAAWRAQVDGGADGVATAADDARRWLDHLPELRAWCRTVRAVARAGELGLAPLVDALRAEQLAPADLAAAFERAFFTAVVEHVESDEPAWRDFDGARHHEQVGRFRADDARLVAAGGPRVVAGWAARRTVRADAAFPGSEVEVVLREARKKRRQKSLRRLLSEIPTLLAQLKPCLLMSPQAIAQYLPVSQELFDVVVFDEASQIPTHDAIGALARGRHVVIVGDAKQLPPTAFFERAMADSDEEEEAPAEDGGMVHDLESILEEAEAAGVPALPLRWHYRSRDESLIAFSNRRFYGGRLHTFPSAAGRADGLGVSFEKVEGRYDCAGSRTNAAEARAVVAWIVAALADPERRGKSIGVVTFNQPQQQLIEDLLEQALLERPELQPATEGGPRGESLFVKNLENVQGDERDVMLFSITFGKDARGRLSLNFGPLNRRGGERRLNVAITRAREKLVVFSSLEPEEIDLARTTATGVRQLRDYLDYARRGASALPSADGAAPAAGGGGLLEEDVARELAARGHAVDRDVGSSGCRIDLAVRDPARAGRHLLAIECDGESYHSGATARDRDRLRQSVMEGLGWRLHRIWSSDWAARRAQEIARLEAAIARARAACEQHDREETERATQRRAGAADGDADGHADGHAPAKVLRQASAPPRPAAPKRAAPPPPSDELRPYRPFPIEACGTREALDDPAAAPKVRELLRRIVAHEGPLHRKPLLQRAARCLAIPRLTSAPEERLEQLADELAVAGHLVWRGEFAWPDGVDPDGWSAVRVASEEEGPRPADQIAPEERRNALLRVLAAGGSGPVDEVAAAAARLLGFKAVQAKTRQLFRDAIDELATGGRCVVQDETVRLNGR